MHLALLFLIGGAIGALGSVAARMRTHRAWFNSVFAGILGALMGGLALPRISGANPMLLAALAAAALVTILAGLRHWLVLRSRPGSNSQLTH